MDGEPTEPRAEAAPVTGTIELDERDLAPAIVRMSPIYRIRWLVVLWVAFSATYSALGGTISKALLPVVMSAAFAVFLFAWPRLTARRLVRSIAHGGDAHVAYRFDHEGLTIRAAGVTTTLAYRQLVRVREVRTALLLYTTSQLANIVPKRAFSQADLPRVRAFLAPRL
jgi:hypothetical protein